MVGSSKVGFARGRSRRSSTSIGSAGPAARTLGAWSKVTIFLTDMGNFKAVVDLRRKFFTAPYPADSIVEVSALYSPDAMFEIEAIAAVAPEQAA